MDIVYIILLLLFLLDMLMEICCMYELGFCYKYKSKIKPVCDFIGSLLVESTGILGCFITPNIHFHLILTYLGFYPFVKYLYDTFIINRKNKLFLIKLQSYAESNIMFNKLFKYYGSVRCEKKDFWVLKTTDEKGISIHIGCEKHNYKLINNKYKNSIDYIIEQIYANGLGTKNKSDLDELMIKVVKDKNLDKSYVNKFIPYKEIKQYKNSIIENSTLFNMLMMSLCMSFYLICYLVHAWNSLSIVNQMLYLILCTISTLFGPIELLLRVCQYCIKEKSKDNS